MLWRYQTLNHGSIFQVRLHDLVNIFQIDIGIPDCLGVDHGHRATGAAIQAARLVDAYLTNTGQTCRPDRRFAMVKSAWALCWAQLSSPFFRSFRQKKMWRS
jgi:hypothetical protein